MHIEAVPGPASSALALFKADLPNPSRLGLAGVAPGLQARDAEAEDPAPTAVEVALRVLDPRAEHRLSLKAANAIHDLVETMRARDGLGALPSDAAFAAAMANTPAHYADMMRARGATRWVWHPEVHPTGVAYFRALAAAIPRDFGNPGSVAEALFDRSANKHPSILRGSDVPAAGLGAGAYDMYNDQGYIGSLQRQDRNEAYFIDFVTSNPTRRILPVYFGNDTAIIIWDR